MTNLNDNKGLNLNLKDGKGLKGENGNKDLNLKCNITYEIKRNLEKDGMEIYFSGKPEKNITNALRLDFKFRYHVKKKLWYRKYDIKLLKDVKQFLKSHEQLEQLNTDVKLNVNEQFSLFKNIQTDIASLIEFGEPKEIARQLKKILKELFPFIKFGITSSYSYNRVYIEFKQSPFNEESEILESIIQCIQHTDKSLPFLFNIEMYDYVQTDETLEFKEMIEQYKKDKEEFIEAERQRVLKEAEKSLKERKRLDEEHKKRLEREELKVHYIVKNVNVIQLKENEMYYYKNVLFPNLSKCSTLADYEMQLTNEEYGYLNDNGLKYCKETVRIERIINFKCEKAYEFYINLLLKDYEFYNKIGGSYTEDKRINTMQDLNNMEPAERKTVKWITRAIEIRLKGDVKFIVNTEGYNYARYVGLLRNPTFKTN